MKYIKIALVTLMFFSCFGKKRYYVYEFDSTVVRFNPDGRAPQDTVEYNDDADAYFWEISHAYIDYDVICDTVSLEYWKNSRQARYPNPDTVMLPNGKVLMPRFVWHLSATTTVIANERKISLTQVIDPITLRQITDSARNLTEEMLLYSYHYNHKLHKFENDQPSFKAR